MAGTPIVLTDAYIAIGGTAYSDMANNVVLTDSADQIETTGFSPAGYKSYIPGLKDATVTVTFMNDFGATGIDSILQPLYATGGTFSLEVRPTSAGVSATNPKWTMTARLYEYSALSGKVGALGEHDAVFHNSGTAGLVRGTA